MMRSALVLAAAAVIAAAAPIVPAEAEQLTTSYARLKRHGKRAPHPPLPAQTPPAEPEASPPEASAPVPPEPPVRMIKPAAVNAVTFDKLWAQRGLPAVSGK